MIYGRHGSTIADVTGDDAFFGRIDTQELADATRYIAMGCAVETITADTVFLIQLVRNGIHVRIIGHGLVESRIEYTHLRDAGQQLADSLDTFQVSRVVQRSQVGIGFPLLEHLVRQQHTFRKFPTMHNAVAYGIKFVQRRQCSNFRIDQYFKYQLDTLVVRRNGRFDHLGPISQLHFQESSFQSYFLNPTRSHDLVTGHVIQLVLNGRTSAIYY